MGNAKSEIRALLAEHTARYPMMQAQDIMKLIYQSAAGPEHMVSDEARVTEAITEECKKGLISRSPEVEVLGAFSRVYLSAPGDGLSPKTLARLFIISAEYPAEGNMEQALACALEIIGEGELSLSAEEFRSQCEQWQREGFPAVRHSEIYRQEYSPAYRLISTDLIKYIPLLRSIDRMLERGERVRLAIDGGAGSGKSTLADLLSRIYESSIIRMDDFFLRPEQRTAERLSEVGGNLDRERFLGELGGALTDNSATEYRYRRFDCGKMALGEEICLPATPLTVIEGSYSLHPELRHLYNLSAFLSISEELQHRRITARNSEAMAQRFFCTWIPMENRYRDAFRIPEAADLVIPQP